MKKRMLLVLAVLIVFCMATACGETYQPILSAGGSFCFLRTGDGQIWGWGDNTSGQLGISNGQRQQLPVHAILAIDGKDVKDIQCGNISTLVLMNDGTLYACGGNDYGQGGSKTKGRYLFDAIPVPGVDHVKQIACGFGQCLALTEDGHVWTWGRNSNGQQADGKRYNRYDPHLLELENIVQVECGGKFSMALDANGDVWGWGDNEHWELLETSKKKNVTVPTKIESLSGRFTRIACCGSSAFGLDHEGKLWSWGRNDFFQLGYKNGNKDQKEPQLVEFPEEIEIADIQAYNSHNAVLTTDGRVFLWGRGSTGQTGNGGRPHSVLPMQIGPEGIRFIDVAVGSSCTYLMAEDGTLYAAGYSEYGQTGAFRGKHFYVTSWAKNGLNALTGVLMEPEN